MKQYLQNKKGLVQNVFNNVYDKYDLMNDFMSFGIHRFWKKDLIMMMSPNINKKLIDVACGTGDIGKLFLEVVKNKGQVFNVDPNKRMIEQGKKRIGPLKNMTWKLGKRKSLDLKKTFLIIIQLVLALETLKILINQLKRLIEY